MIFIPRHTDPLSGKANQNFSDELGNMHKQVEDGRAQVLFLDPLAWRWYIPKREDLEKKYKFPVSRVLRDGVVFGR